MRRPGIMNDSKTEASEEPAEHLCASTHLRSRARGVLR